MWSQWSPRLRLVCYISATSQHIVQLIHKWFGDARESTETMNHQAPDQAPNTSPTPAQELEWAAEEGRLTSMWFLLQHDDGTLVNTVSPDGVTPLMRAARQGHDAAVRLLLLHGANIQAADAKGWGPVRWATECCQPKVLATLISHHPHTSIMAKRAMIRSAHLGHVACMIALLIKFDPVIRAFGDSGLLQARDERTGETPIVWAVRGGHAAAVEYLLDMGADSTERSSDGLPLLALAASRRHEAVVQLLLKRLPHTVNERDAEGRTALTRSLGADNITRLIMNAGADPLIVDNNGWGPRNWALFLGYGSSFHILNLNSKSKSVAVFESIPEEIVEV